ncbi:hypothetical protein PsYK624_124290 [Phanerochaete sordida]|uniref:Uncharacterized protein n=1 Tax=Phanerochaete sordida TaxID=48140 RepID=A0A9P3LID0_9APHY|nr:hypothetical protein PsYK624_124290 [Phanerochaete sordida]
MARDLVGEGYRWADDGRGQARQPDFQAMSFAMRGELRAQPKHRRQAPFLERMSFSHGDRHSPICTVFQCQ